MYVIRLVSILSDLQANLKSEITSLNLQVEEAAKSVATAETSLSNAQNRLNNAPANVYITPYQKFWLIKLHRILKEVLQDSES